MLEVFRDEDGAKRDRMEAATWLADRGFGRPTQTTATLDIHDIPEGIDLRQLSDAELDAIIAAGD